MKPYEFEAKNILREVGIPVPLGMVIEKYEEGHQFFISNKPVVFKAQVLAGGRGKAGVKIAKVPWEVGKIMKEF